MGKEQFPVELKSFVEQGRVVLHLGAHKTATTYLQKTLDAHRSPLRAAGCGVLVPDDTRAKDDPDLAQQPFAVRLSSALNKECSENGLKRLVISEEAFLGSPRNNLTTGDIYPGLSDRLARLPDAFDHENVTILFCIRAYGPYFSSCLTTALRNGAIFERSALKQRLLIAPRGWHDVVADIVSRYPRARLELFRYEDIKGDLGRVMERMVEQPISLPDQTYNRTVSDHAVAAVYEAYAGGASMRVLKSVVSGARKAFPIGPDAPAFSLWDDEESALLSERYDADCARLEPALFG